MKKVTLVLLLLGHFAISQTISFTNDLSSNFVDVWKSAIALGDIDGDGDLDVLISGLVRNTTTTYVTKLYVNDGTGMYTEVVNTPFVGVRDGAMAFADVDGDNDLDILITGEQYEPSAVTNNIVVAELYLNDGLGNYTVVPNSPFDPVRESSVSFGDLDGDGDLDVVISGSTKPTGLGPNTPSTKIYINDGSGVFTDMGFTLAQVRKSLTALGDVDGDGDLDLFVTGETGTSSNVGHILLNDGLGNFSYHQYLLSLYEGDVAFGDVDGDNDLDILITGRKQSLKRTRLYINDGTGTFAWNSSLDFEQVADSSIAFTDSDTDGDLDIIITGFSAAAGVGRIMYLYENDGLGDFSLVTNQPFYGVYYSAIACGDIDGDSDEDIIVTGLHNPSETGAKIYRNGIDALAVTHAEMAQEVTVYPNPVTENMHIQSSLPFTNVVIYNSNGVQVMATKVNHILATTINAEYLKAGVYFIKVTAKDGSIFNQKFVKL